MKKNKAFTLIELVISIGIILVLLSIAGLNFKIRDRVQAREQVKELALDLKFLKNYAQINNMRTSMTLNDQGYSIKFDTKSKEVKFNSLLKLESTNLSEITFSKKGKPSYIKIEVERESGDRLDHIILRGERRGSDEEIKMEVYLKKGGLFTD